MFAIGIKNAILFILIVLIVHVVIMNILCARPSKSVVSKESFAPSASSIQSSLQSLQSLPSNLNSQSLPYPNEATPPICLPPSERNMTNDKEKLLEFVFGQKNKPYNEKGLDDFFKDFSKQISACQKNPYEEQNAVCKAKSDDHSTPLPSTCDPNIQEILKSDDLEKKPYCNTKRDINIISEYKNESSMSGGTLYDGPGGINAFDDFDVSSYSEI